jgi:hypothetical protein
MSLSWRYADAAKQTVTEISFVLASYDCREVKRWVNGIGPAGWAYMFDERQLEVADYIAMTPAKRSRKWRDQDDRIFMPLAGYSMAIHAWQTLEAMWNNPVGGSYRPTTASAALIASHVATVWGWYWPWDNAPPRGWLTTDLLY